MQQAFEPCGCSRHLSHCGETPCADGTVKRCLGQAGETPSTPSLPRRHHPRIQAAGNPVRLPREYQCRSPSHSATRRAARGVAPQNEREREGGSCRVGHNMLSSHQQLTHLSHLKSDAIKTEKHKYVRKQIHKKILQACGQSGLHLCPHNFLPESLLSVSQGRKIQTGCSGWLDIASAAQNEACYQDPAHVQGLRIEGRFAALLSPFIQRSCDLVEIDPCQSAVQPD